MLRIKVLKPICVGLLMTFLSACQFLDSSATSWTMIEVDAQTFAQGKKVSELILVEQGHRPYRIDLLVLHNNDTEQMSAKLDLAVESIQGKEVYLTTVPIVFAEKPGLWQKFGLVSHEVNVRLANPIYIDNPGLYRFSFAQSKAKGIQGITLIGFKLQE